MATFFINVRLAMFYLIDRPYLGFLRKICFPRVWELMFPFLFNGGDVR